MWTLDTLQTIVTLVTGLFGLIGTGVSTFFMVKAIIQKNKGKSATEIWNLLLTMADNAMKAAEASGKSGADKKAMAMEAIKASALAAGIDISAFINQLDAYIEETIKFVNDLTKK